MKILEDFKKDIDSNTIIVGDSNIPLQICTDLPNKTSTNIFVTLKYALDEMDLTDI